MKAKNPMTMSMGELGLQEFNWVLPTKKIKIYISEVPLIRDRFGGDWKPGNWYGEKDFDSIAADIVRSNPEISIHQQKKPSFASEGILALHIVAFAFQLHSIHPVKEDWNFEAKNGQVNVAGKTYYFNYIILKDGCI